MQKIYLGSQVTYLDEAFLEKSGMTSHELMETAAIEFVTWFLNENFPKQTQISIAVGPGNNGGDGFAIARLLANEHYSIRVVEMFDSNRKLSPDGRTNKELLPASIPCFTWDQFDENSADILIDCYLGVGLKGPLREEAIAKINWINQFNGKIISVDIPSGIPAEDSGFLAAVQAEVTVTFQFPKLSLFAPECSTYSGALVVLPVGITVEDSEQLLTNRYYLQAQDIKPLHRIYNRFSFKGDLGKVLLVGGSYGKMGAVQLSCKSALRTGAGLVSCLLDDIGIPILQTAIPEVMCIPLQKVALSGFDSIGIGPGWRISDRKALFEYILENFSRPIVIDADGINLLAENPELIRLIPKNSILTPHLGEFQRLVGPSKDYFDRIERAKNFAVENELIIVLKGANSLIALPDGRQIFNSSGTQYMATAGSGDVLTGMITAYLGMGYAPENAALCGVFHHGLAGELAGKSKRRGLIASDIIEAIPMTYLELGIS
jgi:NAD(P)H-hydrate epimerase